ncbi:MULTISPECIES: twin-arginine translocation pathway signal [Rhodococcus]|uniref:Twin-arginine translocation pathway signal n=1 Tax=Rhodococcus oxybenzonivorans TaxID=1990687 RepID=A0AAE4V1G4_9NOCA|nr:MULTISPECIES: twin-arginine translocation pathway signal [Rhodococcus]MDV7245100.1 twin-arginine translocation pathway signal [Rhodococcus oxybenzonivorans]MDV7266144.1 twin-arginine translocation pathway signal [Rhodococcus oxybenzonivorans]MDV7272617.1 twin-arginine translocation pathway signal [Rhodococcus oxybenzonivorans]MDV7336125.1 twin-arginine translocation pathway signal [Rhodococcus oxybenzonivorans]MDV7342811.1 twin-arginine translocation pathway signal [Rhodococcus oxybenzonivo
MNAEEKVQWWSRNPRRWVSVLAALTAVAAVLAATLYVTTYRADQRVDDDVRAAVTDTASQGAVALLSYTPDTVASVVDTARGRLTGEFLDYYSKFTTEVVVPAAQESQVATEATVAAAGPVDVQADTATVLLFVNQTTTSAAEPEPATTATSINVELTRSGDDWLISGFDPV